jgi:hypothetical protein
MLAKAKA